MPSCLTSSIMVANGVRLMGVKLMQEKDIEEGIDLSASILTEQRWGDRKASETGKAKPLESV